ncbi:MAG: hypothetical protein ACPGRX_00490 [Bdellovibrionales bacterium]
MGQSKTSQLMISREIFGEVHKGFKFLRHEEVTPASGFHDLHDAVCEAFAHVDLPEDDRESVNDLINSLQNLYETLAEQESVAPEADGFFIEREDLLNMVKNIGALGEAIRIHQTGLAHHDVAKALLWCKTALKKIAIRD